MYKGYLIDLDGTIYRGKERIPAAEEFVLKLIQQQIPFIIVTNNATRTTEQIAQSLNEHNDLPVGPEHIYTSTLALIDYLKIHHAGNNIYAIGEDGLQDELIAANFLFDKERPIDVVVQGLDRQITYDKLTVAVQAILAGAAFLVTNNDRLLPSASEFIPSSGAITSFIQYATQVEPIVMGKPNVNIMEGALQKLAIAKEDVLMVGDNYETDISAGINIGMDTLLVLTGITKATEVHNLPIAPTYVRNSLSEWELDV